MTEETPDPLVKLPGCIGFETGSILGTNLRNYMFYNGLCDGSMVRICSSGCECNGYATPRDKRGEEQQQRNHRSTSRLLTSNLMASSVVLIKTRV